MSNAQHTPGPWKVVTFGMVVESADGVRVCETHATDREANARLIAAAPELLEALESVTRCLQWHNEQHGVGMDEAAIAKAVAAIAKASG